MALKKKIYIYTIQFFLQLEHHHENAEQKLEILFQVTNFLIIVPLGAFCYSD